MTRITTAVKKFALEHPTTIVIATAIVTAATTTVIVKLEKNLETKLAADAANPALDI